MDNKIDAIFEQKGLWRKQIPKDPSCLFRITSEYLYGTQARHQLVREECARFMKTQNYIFKQRIKKHLEGDFELYLENLTNPKFYAGEIEMEAMSLRYRVNYQVYEEKNNATPMLKTTLTNANDMITLFYTLHNHYDVLYPIETLATTAFCQSLVYNILYKNVFKLGDDIDYAVQKMLYDKEYAKQKRSFYDNKNGKNNTVISAIELSKDDEKYSEIKKNLSLGTPPFPYTSSKALDPGIYRNIELHWFNERKREQIRSEQLITPDLDPGVKCLFKPNDANETYHVHIQEIKSDGNATVFIEELGEKTDVPIERLTPVPIPVLKAIAIEGLTSKSSTMLENYMKNYPNIFDKLMQNHRKGNKKGICQDYMLYPFLHSTSLLKLTQTHILSTQNSKALDVKNETKNTTFPRNFTPKNRDVKNAESKSLRHCKADYRETKVLQSTWSMAQASTLPIVTNKVEKAQISTSELKNTCMTVSKVTKPTESKSTIVTKETKTTVKELNFKAKNPRQHSKYIHPIPKKPIISKPITSSMKQVMNSVSIYNPPLLNSPYPPQDDFNINSVPIQQSYYQNPITSCLSANLPNYNYPNEYSFDYSMSPPIYYPYFPTNNGQFMVPYINTLQIENPNNLYGVTNEVQVPTTSSDSNVEFSQMPNYWYTHNSNFCTSYTDILRPQPNTTCPENFSAAATTIGEFSQTYAQNNNIPVFVVYNTNYPIMYDNGRPQLNLVPNGYVGPQ